MELMIQFSAGDCKISNCKTQTGLDLIQFLSGRRLCSDKILNPGPSNSSGHKSVWGPAVCYQLPRSGMRGEGARPGHGLFVWRGGAQIFNQFPGPENLTDCILCLCGELFSNPSIINTLRDTNESLEQVKPSTYG